MKKTLTLAILAVLLCSQLWAPSIAQAASETPVSFTPYTALKGLYIQTPAYQSSTTSSRISILGACTPNLPLTVNGQSVATTASGFFAVCLPLEVGENYFTVQTPTESTTLTVTRTRSSKGAIPATITKPLSAQYGIIKTDNITHRQGPSQDSQLLLPLVQGTACAITGQCGSYYQLRDGTFIFKSSVDVTPGELPPNPLSRVYLRDISDTITTYAWQMPVQALYQVSLNGDSAIVTFRETQSANCKIAQPSIGPVTAIKRVSQDSDKDSVFKLTFDSKAKVNGYDLTYTNGELLLSFKQAPQLSNASLKGARILLDAGHGGSDTGALGPAGIYGPQEKDINLQIAQYTKAYLENKGALVLMNRSDDTASSLAQRVATIKNTKPDVALSIHANSVDNTADLTKASGTLVFYTFEKDAAFAEAISTAVSQSMGWSGTPPRSSNLALTRTTTCPTALIETKFMSNPDDYEWLIQPANQKALGQAIGQALENYLLLNSPSPTNLN